MKLVFWGYDEQCCSKGRVFTFTTDCKECTTSCLLNALKKITTTISKWKTLDHNFWLLNLLQFTYSFGEEGEWWILLPPSSDFWSPLTWSFGWRSHLIEVANLVFWFWHILLIKIVYLVFYFACSFDWYGKCFGMMNLVISSQNIIRYYALKPSILRLILQQLLRCWPAICVHPVLTGGSFGDTGDKGDGWCRWVGEAQQGGRAGHGQGSLAEDSWIQAEGILWRQWAARPVGRDIAPGRRRCASTGSVAASRRLWRHFYVLPPTVYSYKIDSGKFCLNFSDSVMHHVSLLKPSLSNFCTNLVP